MTSASLYWLQGLKGHAVLWTQGVWHLGRPRQALESLLWPLTLAVVALRSVLSTQIVRPCIPRNLPGSPRDLMSGMDGITGVWLPREGGQLLLGEQGWPEASSPCWKSSDKDSCGP